MKGKKILKPATQMVFQCTWRSCGHECDIRSLMEEHVRLKHLGLTSCTDDNEEDFYYTEIEVESPLCSSGGSTAESLTNLADFTRGEELLENEKFSTQINEKNNNSESSESIDNTTIKKDLKHDFKNMIELSATWMHMDMSKPPHEDPEFLFRMNNKDSIITLNNKKYQKILIKKERKRMTQNYNQYLSNRSESKSTSQQQYFQNLTTDQLINLEHKNDLHLKNNIQHMKQLHCQNQEWNDLYQPIQSEYHQKVKRKYAKNQNSSGNPVPILMSATRKKSIIYNAMQFENESDSRFVKNYENKNNPDQVQRSRPIKIPGISLAHKETNYNSINHSPSFAVGSIQSSPTGYFNYFSPTPPHSLSSPTSSSSSMYSSGSCNSPESSSITSGSSFSSGQSSFNHNSTHFSPIDTLLQTVENERIQQQLTMKNEPFRPTASIISNNSTTSSSIKSVSKVRSANVSDLDFVTQNEEENTSDHQLQKTEMTSQFVKNKSELGNQTSKIIDRTNSNLLIASKKDSTNKKTKDNAIILEQDDILLAECLIEEFEIDSHNKTNLTKKNLIDLQTKQQQLVQTAQQALVTLASAATHLCNETTSQMQSTNHNINLTNKNVRNSKNIENNSIDNIETDKYGSVCAKNDISHQKSQKNDTMITKNLIHPVEKSYRHSHTNKPFNYLFSQSGRTIKPTAAAKSYVQRKNRTIKHIRTHNSKNRNGIAKSKNSKLKRLNETFQSNNDQNEIVMNSNLMSGPIISSTDSSNIANSNQTQESSFIQRTPTGRIRNFGAKCRKKFGMENKEKWCVQCRWKKACSRVDSNNNPNFVQHDNNQAAVSEMRNRSRPSGRSANNSSNNLDLQCAVPQEIESSISSSPVNSHQNNTSNTSGEFSKFPEDLFRSETLSNDNRTVVSAK